MAQSFALLMTKKIFTKKSLLTKKVKKKLSEGIFKSFSFDNVNDKPSIHQTLRYLSKKKHQHFHFDSVERDKRKLSKLQNENLKNKTRKF